MPYGELWREFGADSARRRAATDVGGYAIFCVVMTAAAARLTLMRYAGEIAPHDELRQHAATMALAMVGAGASLALTQRIYLQYLRPFLLIWLRIATATSPILTRSAMAMIQWAPKHPALRTLTTAFAVLLEDHLMLHTLLALALPLNIPVSAAVQSLCIWIISHRNLTLCYAGDAALGEHRLGICIAASLISQVIMGIVLPVWHIACADSAAAVQWWERRVGRPGRSRRYAAYAWIHANPCSKYADVVKRATLGIVLVWVYITLLLWAAGM